MSQINKILEKLNEGRWICSTELIDLYCVDYRARINDLRKRGYIIRGEPCKGRCGKQHNASLSRWYLELKAPQTQEFAPTREFKSCCFSYAKFGTHDPKCVVLEDLAFKAKWLEKETERNLRLI